MFFASLPGRLAAVWVKTNDVGEIEIGFTRGTANRTLFEKVARACRGVARIQPMRGLDLVQVHEMAQFHCPCWLVYFARCENKIDWGGSGVTVRPLHDRPTVLRTAGPARVGVNLRARQGKLLRGCLGEIRQT
jgi:hypothetical protein